MSNDNAILEMLAKKADEENRTARQAKESVKKEKQKRKIKGSSRKKTEEPQREGSREEIRAPEMPETLPRTTSRMDPVAEEKLPELEENRAVLPETETEEDPFAYLADRIKEEGDALKEKPIAAPKKEKKTPGLKMPKGGLGEEVTKEEAEKALSNRELGGRRRTVIVRTKVVDADGNPVPKGGSGEKKEAAAPQQEEAPESEDRPLHPRLRLIREDTGEVYDIDRDMTIGRDEDNDIVIPNPVGHYVSAHHGEILIQGKTVFLKDLDSRNGTYVNDRKIGSWRLKAGNIVEFADIRFAVEEI